jgi:hypothetical protein
MDATLQRCPNCNHTVSSSVGNCAYCGAKMSAGEPQGQAVEKIASEETRSSPPPPPLQSVQSAATEPPEAALEAEAGAPEPVAQAGDSPAADTEPAASGDVIPEKAEVEINPDSNMIEPAAEPGSEISQPGDDIAEDAEIVLKESFSRPPVAPVGSEPGEASPPEAQAPVAAATDPVGNTPQAETLLEQVQKEPAARELQASSEPEVRDPAGDEADDLETLGSDIVAMVEREAAARQELEKPPAGDTSSAPKNDGGDAGADRKDDPALVKVEEIAAETESALMPESLEETILLEEPVGQVASAAAAEPVTLETSAKSEIKKPAGGPQTRPDPSASTSKAPAKAASAKKQTKADVAAEILKIEKAAQNMVAAIEKKNESQENPDESEKQSAAEAKAQALKKQKAALAKAQAQKKKSLILSQAAALKRKKAAAAKAQALKKQKQAQANLEAAHLEEAAAAPVKGPGSRSAAAGGGATERRIQNLLQKYQGQAIGINYDNSIEIKEAELVEANREFFSVYVRDKKLHYSYPLKNIFTVIEGKDGVEAGDSKAQEKFKAVIKVYPLAAF